ncbi:probable cytochrome P450 6g2 [Eupeodes corollae]|uniref:probable cytochrome P450 6g2 n=1 Tax=Eupeodes corollae TaxID=290404 RepID=UPI0024901BEB|nr:probable cytochrome P450 6g2 [Eupeodes corollae]
MDLITELLLFVTFILFGIYIWANHHFSYWRNKNVAYVEPNYFFGNFKDMLMMSKNCADVIKDLYNHKNAKDQPILGIYIFNKPALLIRDPELVKSICVKNFDKFSDRYAQSDTKGDTLGSATLFMINNPEWKELRTKLSPVFTSGKMKQMFPLIQEIGNNLDTYINSFQIDKNSNSFVREVREICFLFTTDVIATVAFGIKTSSLKNPKDAFLRVGRSTLDFTLWRGLQFVVAFFIPHLASLFRCKLFAKDTEVFFRKTINSVMDNRIKNGTTRNDLIDVLAELKKQCLGDSQNNNNLPMTNDILVAQAATFFIAGLETSASTMSFCLYELSKNPEIQERLREEIRQALLRNITLTGKDTLTYEDVYGMEYLDMVIMETLRLYPSLPILDRICTLPKDEKEFSLKPFSDFAIPNNMPVYVPKIAIHRDSKYFPNPDKFDPERFSAKNKPNIQTGTYLAFGLGPRSCIGYRMGLLKTKIGLISFLRNHILTTCDKTTKQIFLDPKALFVQTKGGIYCKFIRDPLI